MSFIPKNIKYDYCKTKENNYLKGAKPTKKYIVK